MLKLSNGLLNIPILSLRAGRPIATAIRIIINPNNLKVEGWYVQDDYSKQELVLVSSEVRDIMPQGIAINDHEVLVEAEDLIRLKDVLDINYDLIGKYVASQSGGRYGKVTDFAVETSSLFVKKIYASQSMIKSIAGGNLSIDRTQIVEITNKTIIIEDPTVDSRATAATPVTAN